MAIGTPTSLGFWLGTQLPVDMKYLKNGAPYADTSEVLSLIPLSERCPYLTVNVMGVEYWFSADMLSLSLKTASSAPAIAIPFTSTSSPSISNYNTTYAATYGQYPTVILLTTSGSNYIERPEKPIRNIVSGYLDSIVWDLAIPETGLIILKP